MVTRENGDEVPGGVTRPARVLVRNGTEFVDAAAAWIANAIADALASQERCSVGLVGGRTPRAIYRHLAERYVNVPWSLLDIYFGDERCVPPEDRESNYRMAHESLLSRVPIDPAHVHRMAGEGADPVAAAREYDALLPDALDLLLLGMGTDGHTASLFPGAPELHERERRVLHSISPVPPTNRLTVTPPVIAMAHRVAVIVAGQGKSAMVARALEGAVDPAAIPVQFALHGCWLLDDGAASHLRVVPA